MQNHVPMKEEILVPDAAFCSFMKIKHLPELVFFSDAFRKKGLFIIKVF